MRVPEINMHLITLHIFSSMQWGFSINALYYLPEESVLSSHNNKLYHFQQYKSKYWSPETNAEDIHKYIVFKLLLTCPQLTFQPYFPNPAFICVHMGQHLWQLVHVHLMTWYETQ
jgi:hypothetical protein